MFEMKILNKIWFTEGNLIFVRMLKIIIRVIAIIIKFIQSILKVDNLERKLPTEL